MHKRRFRKLFYFFVFLFLLSAKIGLSQTPSADLDSITEDSYQRMLARQKAEKESDSIRKAEFDLALTNPEIKEQKGFQNLMLTFLIIGLGFLFWYLRRTSKARDSFKK
jgi:hypothetical protein